MNATAIWVASALGCAFAAGGAAAAVFDDLQPPTPATVWEIEGGYRWDHVAGRDSDGYYRVNYRGSPVAQKGTPFKQTEHVLSDAPKPTLLTDRADWSFTYEHGSVSTGGGLLQGEALMPLDLRLPKDFMPRGTAFVGGDSTFKQVNIAVGLETPPLHVGALSQLGITHWAVVGISAQRREETDSAVGDKNFAAASYRGFIGKAFLFHPKASVGELAQRVSDAYLREAPTLKDAKAVADNLKQSAAKGTTLTVFQEAFIDAASDVSKPEEWPSAALRTARAAAEGVLQQPTFAVYSEVSGWYEMRGDDGTSRSRALFTLTADYWFLATRDDVFLRLRYENGYERGNPQNRKNQMLAAIALRF